MNQHFSHDQGLFFISLYQNFGTGYFLFWIMGMKRGCPAAKEAEQRYEALKASCPDRNAHPYVSNLSHLAAIEMLPQKVRY